MESKQRIKSEVYKILDEIIEINEVILYSSGNEYNNNTLMKLTDYRNVINEFAENLAIEHLVH